MSVLSAFAEDTDSVLRLAATPCLSPRSVLAKWGVVNDETGDWEGSRTWHPDEVGRTQGT